MQQFQVDFQFYLWLGLSEKPDRFSACEGVIEACDTELCSVPSEAGTKTERRAADSGAPAICEHDKL